MKFILAPIKLFFLLPLLIACERDISLYNEQLVSDTLRYNYKTKNVIILVIDGPRYSETWGDSTHQYIPKTSGLLKDGVIFSNFHNSGPTYTNAGFTAITTGNYQEIDNTGQELPENPSVFQYWLKKNEGKKERARIIESKGKLNILSDCRQQEWKGNYNPAVNCGIDGGGNGYREDSATFSAAIEELKQHHPTLALIGFREPDYSGHQNNWNGYLEGIKKTDEYIFLLWNFLQSDSLYKNTTSIFVTNDHGRHLDGVNGGFANHGDDCEGCRHINLFVAGPDFIQNKIISSSYELVDISATIAELMGFEMLTGKGKVMREIFR